MIPWIAVAFPLAVASSAAATWIAKGFASRAGLSDDPASAPERKLQPRAVPAVGGIAILFGLAAARALPTFAWIGVVLAFLLGAIDDRRRGGLPALALLSGQAIVAAALVGSGWRICQGPEILSAPASALAVLAAINAVNTFDNADGAATSLGILGLSLGAPILAAPLVGFLPWNLLAGGGTRPAAYLGNSGSFVVGLLLLLDPIARFALVLPLLDLGRLVVVRASVGHRPWVGDRRHLAHRLQNAGLSRVSVVLVLTALAAPAVLGAKFAPSLGPSAAALGVLATTALAAATILLSPRIG